MKREVLDCDFCGEKNCLHAQSLIIETGSQIDIVTCRQESVCERIDLCSKCMAKSLELLLHELGWDCESRKAWIHRNKKKQ